MIRARFRANEDDWRPVKWPPPGPCWCTGYGETYSVVVAFCDSEEQILEYWPEAEDIESTPNSEITFSSRFPKPEWWN